ncbi:MAG: hypothetical protein QM817_13135 [Archangium sp.]
MGERNVERREGFEHVCVIEGLIVDIPTKEFEKQLGEMLGVRVQYLETIVTLPTRTKRGVARDTGGRHDVLFAYHRDDYSSEFNARRMARQIRWFEDAISPRNNPRGLIYPERVREYVAAPVRKLLEAEAVPKVVRRRRK